MATRTETRTINSVVLAGIRRVVLHRGDDGDPIVSVAYSQLIDGQTVAGELVVELAPEPRRILADFLRDQILARLNSQLGF